MIDRFPDYWNAPYDLLKLDGNCGLVTAWGVLRYFHRRTSATRIVKATRYTKKYGVFPIALACCLREHGLSVRFYSEPDPDIKRIEQRCYKLAATSGIEVLPAIELKTVLSKISSRTLAVVSYLTDSDNGHLSPMLGHENGVVNLPYEINGETMRLSELARRIQPLGICRQCLLVSSDSIL